MDRKKLEYIIIACVIILLVYSVYFLISYEYDEEQVVLDSINMSSPAGSQYKVAGDRVEFRNHVYDLYDLDVTRMNSSDERVSKLLNFYSHFRTSSADFKNETCYILTVDFDDDSGFGYHCLLIPINSFNRHNLTFTKPCTVWVFDGKDRDFVVDSAFTSEVEL